VTLRRQSKCSSIPKLRELRETGIYQMAIATLKCNKEEAALGFQCPKNHFGERN